MKIYKKHIIFITMLAMFVLIFMAIYMNRISHEKEHVTQGYSHTTMTANNNFSKLFDANSSSNNIIQNRTKPKSNVTCIILTGVKTFLCLILIGSLYFFGGLQKKD